MILSRLSSRDRRALQYGTVVCVLTALWTAGVRPYWRERSALTDQIASQRLLLSRELALVGQSDPRVVFSANAAGKVGRRAFSEVDEEMSSAAAAKQLAREAATHSVEVRQLSIGATTSGPAGLRVLHVDLAATADLEGLVTFLAALESGDKSFRVDRLVIDNGDRFSARGSAEGEVLSVALSVSALASRGNSVETRLVGSSARADR